MANGSKTVLLKPQGVTFEDVINVARFNAKVEISDEAKLQLINHANLLMSTPKVAKLSMGYQQGLEHSLINLLIQRIELSYKNL